MKRNLFFFALGALALTACTSEEVVEDVAKKQNVIGFENVVDKLSRADDLTSGTLKQFNVFGFYTTPDNAKVAVEVFNDTPVEKQSGGTWAYKDKDRYWVPGAHYYFYAYSCGSIAKLNSDYGQFSIDLARTDLTAADRTFNITNYLCDATHQHDLIFATNTGATETDAFAGILGKEKGNGLVSFQFKHLLSKVKAQFTSDFPTDYTVEISDVSLENIRNIGDYNSNGGWKNVSRLEEGSPYVFLLDTDYVDEEGNNPIKPVKTIAGQDPAVTNTAFVLPFTYNGEDATETTPDTWVYLKFTLTVYNKGEKILVKELTGKFNPSWIEGYSYTYNVVVSGSTANLQVIAFTTIADGQGNIITNWGSDDNGKIEIDSK